MREVGQPELPAAVSYLCAVDGCPNDAEHFHPDRYVAFCHDHFPYRQLSPHEDGSWDGMTPAERFENHSLAFEVAAHAVDGCTK